MKVYDLTCAGQTGSVDYTIIILGEMKKLKIGDPADKDFYF